MKEEADTSSIAYPVYSAVSWRGSDNEGHCRRLAEHAKPAACIILGYCHLIYDFSWWCWWWRRQTIIDLSYLLLQSDVMLQPYKWVRWKCRTGNTGPNNWSDF